MKRGPAKKKPSRTKPEPKTDDAPFVPVYDKPPAERSPKEIKQAIESDVLLEWHGEHSR
jgi:hypothetical protein